MEQWVGQGVEQRVGRGVGQRVGGAPAVLSVAGPLSADTDGATVPTPTVMHLVVGAGAILAPALHRRHRPGG
ncbi:DUF6069 family protein [Streptomyces calidiresistens]